MKDTITRKFLLDQLSRLIKSELKALCLTEGSNLLYQKSSEALKKFSWGQLMSEMELKAPVLLFILKVCTVTKGNNKYQYCDWDVCWHHN